MNLTNSQIKKANKLLKELCSSGKIEDEEIYSFFDSIDEAIMICSLLKDKDLLFYFPTDHGIAQIRCNVKTCNAVKNKLLDSELKIEKLSNVDKQLKIIELIKGYWKLIIITITIVTILIGFVTKCSNI